MQTEHLSCKILKKKMAMNIDIKNYLCIVHPITRNTTNGKSVQYSTTIWLINNAAGYTKPLISFMLLVTVNYYTHCKINFTL